MTASIYHGLFTNGHRLYPIRTRTIHLAFALLHLSIVNFKKYSLRHPPSMLAHLLRSVRTASQPHRFSLAVRTFMSTPSEPKRQKMAKVVTPHSFL